MANFSILLLIATGLIITQFICQFLAIKHLKNSPLIPEEKKRYWTWFILLGLPGVIFYFMAARKKTSTDL